MAEIQIYGEKSKHTYINEGSEGSWSLGQNISSWPMKQLLDSFVIKNPQYQLEEEYKDNPHVFGKGSSSVQNYQIKKDTKPLLSIDIKKSYWTTSDDFFDFNEPTEVHISLPKKKNLVASLLRDKIVSSFRDLQRKESVF